MSRSENFWRTYWMITVVTLIAAVVMLFTYTPVERTMGPVQKIFYLHMPSAINTFLAALVAFIGGIGYLAHQNMRWDDISSAATKIAALMCTIVLVTGMIWAKKAWGAWWVWSPRLILSLVLWLLYVVYVVIRPAMASASQRATIGAVYVIAAFLNVPLVFLSTRLIEEPHPATITLEPSMKLTLMVWFVPVTLVTIGLIAAAARASGRRRTQGDRSTEETPWSVSEPPREGSQDPASASVRCESAGEQG